MDPVTHIAVGAALGEMALGGKIGRRAMLYGAIAGDLPDLDILMAPFEDDLGFLTNHRGLTHCFLFVIVTSLVLGWLLAKWYGHGSVKIGFTDTTLLFLGCLLSHVTLDACTTYGTPLFLPFSDRRVAFNSVFIIDPLFTLPLLVCVIVCLFCRHGRARRTANCVGLTIGCLYLGLTCVNKYQVQQVFAESLASQRIQATRFMTAPTPLNDVLWYCLAETEDGYWMGYYSLLDKGRPVEFRYIPRRDELLGESKDTAVIRRLIWFSDGYYAVRQEEGEVFFDVLKFGLFPLGPDGEQSPFCFAIQRGESEPLTVTKVARQRDLDFSGLTTTLWRRIWGTDTQ